MAFSPEGDEVLSGGSADRTFEMGRRLVVADDPLVEDAGDDFPAANPVCHAYTRDGSHAYVTLGPPLAEGGLVVAGWPDTEPSGVTSMLADPCSYPAPDVVSRIGTQRPGHRVIGGLISGGRGSSRLVLGSEIHEEGAVGVVLHDVDVDTVAGLLAAALGKVPLAGDRATIAGLELTAEGTVGRRNRIETVRVARLPESEPHAADVNDERHEINV